MSKALVALAGMMVVLPVRAIATEIAVVPWTEPNVDTLRAFDKAAVVQFINRTSGREGTIVAARESDLGDFAWIDAAGNGKYQLVVVMDANGRGFFNNLTIYSRDSSGKVSFQYIEGWGIGWDLSKVVRDLNGDGVKELIIPKQFFWFPTVATPSWPAVYRLQYGKYVEASRDFPNYYDTEVLPPLEEKIAKLEQQAASTVAERQAAEEYIAEHGWWDSYDRLPGEQYAAISAYAQLAVAQMVRAKILRVVRRDPRAGVAEAREWMKSSDQQVRQAAGQVFRDVGGHEKELRELRRTGQRLLDISRARREQR
jgi:hypothetical protein